MSPAEQLLSAQRDAAFARLQASMQDQDGRLSSEEDPAPVAAPIFLRQWWAIHLALVPAALALLALGLAVAEPSSFIWTATSFLVQAAVAAFLFEALAANATRIRTPWALRHFSDRRRRVATVVVVSVLGGFVLAKVVSGVVSFLLVVVPLLLIAAVLNFFMSPGTSVTGDRHPGYWKDAKGNTHSRTSPPPPGFHR